MNPLRPVPDRLARLLLLTAVWLGWNWPASAAFRSRTERFDVQSWNRDDGLPDNAAERLLLAHDGWLWIGTRSGLARFDGLKFTVYDGQTPGFTDDAILDLAEDAEGSLWIATKRGLYRKQGGTFTKFTTADGLLHNQVNHILPAPDRGLWLATIGGVNWFTPGASRQFADPGPDFRPGMLPHSRRM